MRRDAGGTCDDVHPNIALDSFNAARDDVELPRVETVGFVDVNTDCLPPWTEGTYTASKVLLYTEQSTPSQ